jgi:uncharacterized protein YjaG (DUF416 family)
MGEFLIPHQPPIRFAHSIIKANEQECFVNISFKSIPTLAMFLESAAQSSLAMLDDDSTMEVGFFVSLKNTKLLKEPTAKDYIAKVKLISNLDTFKNQKFEIFDYENSLIATGNFSVMLQ